MYHQSEFHLLPGFNLHQGSLFKCLYAYILFHFPKTLNIQNTPKRHKLNCIFSPRIPQNAGFEIVTDLSPVLRLENRSRETILSSKMVL